MKKLNLLMIVLLMFGLIACSSNSPQEDDLMSDANAVEMAQDDSDALEIAEDDLYDENVAEKLSEEKVEADVAQLPDENIEVNTAGIEYYEVQKGDTLMLIAFKIYGDYIKWKNIASLNQDLLNESMLIKVGTRLKYEAPVTRFEWKPEGNPYLIVRGDTLVKVSGKVYNSSKYWKDIWSNNRPMIKDPKLIFAGFTLHYLPLRDLASR